MHPMHTAPRDGTPVILHHEYVKRCAWRWHASESQWVNDDGMFWREGDPDSQPAGWEPCDA